MLITHVRATKSRCRDVYLRGKSGCLTRNSPRSGALPPQVALLTVLLVLGPMAWGQSQGDRGVLGCVAELYVESDKHVFTQLSLVKNTSEAGRLWAQIDQVGSRGKIVSGMYKIPPGMTVRRGSVVRVEAGRELPMRGSFFIQIPNRVVEVLPEGKCNQAIQELRPHDM